MVQGTQSLIRLASPDLHDEDLERVLNVLKSGELVQGKAVEEFENLLSEFTQIPHAIAVSSCTAALHLALISLEIGVGDRVLVPAFTYPATANAVERCGANIELCDVDPLSYVVTPESIEQHLKSNIQNQFKALIVVHEFGFPADMKAISEIAKRYGVLLIEDAACALGTSANGHHPGFYSDVACLSFHPRKAITTGEGGALLTSSSKLMEKFKQLRNHGINNHNGVFDFVEAGLNYRLTNFQAALGIGQLKRFQGELDARKKLAAIYVEELKSLTQIRLPKLSPGHSWQSFMITNQPGQRDGIKRSLADDKIESNLGAQALNCLTYYQNKYQFTQETCPNASMLFTAGLVLPLYGKLTPKNIRYICQCLKKILGECQ
jgi:dTDP-4-amino-4,6-dideoxygalactose transaminase